MSERPGTRHKEEPEDDEPKSSLNNKQPLIIIAASVVLSLLAAFVFANSYLVMRTPYEEDITGIVDDMGVAKQEVAASKATVDSAVANLASSVTTQVNNALTQVTNRLNTIEANTQSAKDLATSTNQQVTAVSGSVASLTTSLADLNAKLDTTNSNIATQQTQLNLAIVRIAELESKVTSGNGDVLIHEVIDISCTITNDGFPTGTDNMTYIGIKLTLTNKEARDLEDIIIQVPIDVYTSSGEQIIYRNITTSGWSFREWGGDYFIIRGRGIKLDANDTEKIRLSIKLGFSGEVQNGAVEVDEDDIEIIEWDYE